MEFGRHFVGEELKLAVSVDCIDMDTDPWSAVVRCGNKEKRYDRSGGAVKSDGRWMLLVNTKELGAGAYYLIMDYDIPDSDFPDGMRHVVKEELWINVERVLR